MKNFLGSSYSSVARPALIGRRGAIATAHPLATAAGQETFAAGGNAADALIAAQAVLSVVAPEACGLALSGLGGAMSVEDFVAHRTEVLSPISVTLGGWKVSVQPPPAQGVLLAMSLQALNGLCALRSG